MKDLSHEIGLLRREVRDCRSISGNVDHKLTRLIEGADGAARPRRDGSLVVRLVACRLLALPHNRRAAAVAQEIWPTDMQLRAATAPAMTGTAGWAAELVSTMTADIADRLLPPSVFSRLREQGLAYDFTGDSITKVPSVQPVASGAFVAEGGAIPMRQLLIGSLSLPPKKAASILAITKETLRGSPANVETSLEAILSEDLTLAVDGLLLDDIAADLIRPAGLRYGVAGLTPSAAGTPTEKVVADIKALIGAIAPAMRPVLIAGRVQAAGLSILGSGLTVPVIAAPYLPADMLIAVNGTSRQAVQRCARYRLHVEMVGAEPRRPHQIRHRTEPPGWGQGRRAGNRQGTGTEEEATGPATVRSVTAN